MKFTSIYFFDNLYNRQLSNAYQSDLTEKDRGAMMIYSLIQELFTYLNYCHLFWPKKGFGVWNFLNVVNVF